MKFGWRAATLASTGNAPRKKREPVFLEPEGAAFGKSRSEHPSPPAFTMKTRIIELAGTRSP